MSSQDKTVLIVIKSNLWNMICRDNLTPYDLSMDGGSIKNYLIGRSFQ